MLHKREGRHAEKAHKVGIFIDMIQFLQGKGYEILLALRTCPQVGKDINGGE
jgi:hypothetical protein